MEREEEELEAVRTKRKSNVRIENLGHGVMFTRAEPRLETKKHKRQSRKKVKQSFLEKHDDDDFEDKILY
ncbi:hypothetical protein RD792_016558 [Penstemon davidsonii]|uniref:Uncharacterized protein n=1 Tax=Penstemon davidsonii TaxID=160366 RepID=A0ABR0CLF5_9LAMI|nr:hypothetical protein RD792_016558 [Penstemon davidsonii]